MKKKKKFDKSIFKKSNEELQEYMKFKKRSGIVPPKKGKGSFKRKDRNHRGFL